MCTKIIILKNLMVVETVAGENMRLLIVFLLLVLLGTVSKLLLELQLSSCL